MNTKIFYTKTFLYFFVVLVCDIIQSVDLPFWFNSLNNQNGAAYFIILLAATMYTMIYGIIFFIIKFVFNKKTPAILPNFKILFVLGFVYALMGILIAYSSPIYRTSPLMMIIISNSSIFFSIIATKLLIERKKYIDYCAIKPCVSLIIVIIAIIFPIVGSVINRPETNIKSDFFVWLIISFIGFALGALYNVLQEKYLNEYNYFYIGSDLVNYIFMLFWSSFFMLLTVLMLFWVDIIPYFGMTNGIYNFLNNQFNMIQCFVRISCNYKNTIYGLILIISYTVSNFMITALNKDSANFAVYITLLQTPAASMIFIVSGFGTAVIPLWSSICSFVFLMIGLAIWKHWEITEIGKNYTLFNNKNIWI
ncbi:hypothetical protein QJ856_gp0896 [Tupanvirus deep ocean]|uniref:Uncharacterized protein n=2 Tax=Tupanvirus TaxID=2094720 RepID=A0AC62A7X0_9VIRU|nr:hypothetical protein QJ856_gp0896 [Tupanvirus deep ocean]QKU33861.1 hypothetical protein [Tupanvirus deep ocean]